MKYSYYNKYKETNFLIGFIWNILNALDIFLTFVNKKSFVKMGLTTTIVRFDIILFI